MHLPGSVTTGVVILRPDVVMVTLLGRPGFGSRKRDWIRILESDAWSCGLWTQVRFCCASFSGNPRAGPRGAGGARHWRVRIILNSGFKEVRPGPNLSRTFYLVNRRSFKHVFDFLSCFFLLLVSNRP